jgi:hypothetical protein
MGVLVALALGLLVAIGGKVNTADDNNITQIEGNEDKAIEAYSVKKVGKKLPHFYVEEILCNLADNVWDTNAQKQIKSQFQDKDVKLSGTVHDVKYNAIDGCYVKFTQKRADSLADGWGIIICYFSDDAEIEKVMDLNKGDIVTITGHGSKYQVNGLSFYNCNIKSK